MPFQDTLLMLTFTLPRLTAALTFSPFFGQQFIQRNRFNLCPDIFIACTDQHMGICPGKIR